MKGILLAGGNGRRLNPLTDVTNKHLLPVYDRPMIFYPLQTLLDAGINDITIVTGKEYAGGFLKLLGSGRAFNARFTFEIQEEAGGIAQALGITEHVAGGENVAVILGDNIFEDTFASEVANFKGGAHIFLKELPDAQRFGVAEVENDKVINIEEKPENPKTNLAVTGFYLYENSVFDVVKNLKPSHRGELEITDVNNYFIGQGNCDFSFVDGDWTDAGTFESLFRANYLARDIFWQKNKDSEEGKILWENHPLKQR